MNTDKVSKEPQGNDVNHVLPAVFQSDKQWAVAQEKGTVYLNTLSWTRKEAIKKFMGGMDEKLKWEYFKNKYGIHCKKVTVSFQNGW
jgi:phosphopantetheinyl transferase